ncbi:MAG: hypothetical protein Athens071416_28 [Parcubacteria group bacterium Athens0714_16]|nr:MAG: hypothetical protein Athens071416_28 [Parcubacteria group bacterium Athens0714_16]
MKVKFKYEKEKDVWCLLNKGKSSILSQSPTIAYTKLVSKFGENPDEKSASLFIDEYLKENNFNVNEYVSKYQKEFDNISEKFQKRAEEIFKVFLKEDVTIYLTVNERLPYNIKENYTFACIGKGVQRHSIMHELWHFYTWYRWGKSWVDKLGSQKYHDIKESLTILLNFVCKDLMPENLEDTGYPQHKELREKIVKLWKEKQDIEYIWENIIK